ncbi:DMT family transporter [Shewanella maritima]|uniref:DMT family transporter n=1 Tax=Shewanella maritima TaxID=2520507 RepID=UPI003736FE4B
MRASVYLLLATLLAAVGWVASKVIVETMPGESFIGLRFLVASLILLPFCYKAVIKLRLKQWLFSLMAGVVLGVGLQIWMHAVTISDGLSEGAFIMSLAMLIAPLVAWLLYQITPNRAFWLALPVSIAGMALLTLANGWQLAPSQGLFLLSSVTMSFHFVLNKRLTANIAPLVAICVQMMAVAGVSLVYVSMIEQASYNWTVDLFMWFIVSTVAATAIRYLLQTIGQSGCKIETAALIMLLEPVWTMLLSVSFLGEQVATQKLFGGGLILLSLVLYIKMSKREQ